FRVEYQIVNSIRAEGASQGIASELLGIWLRHFWRIVIQASDSAICCYPEPTEAVFSDAADACVSKSIARVVVCETIPIETTQALRGAEPDIAFTILIDRVNAAAGKPFRNTVTAERKLLSEGTRYAEQHDYHQALH